MHLLIVTLLVQCYMPFIWKITALKRYDSRVILLINYVVTVVLSAIVAVKQNLFSVLTYLPEARLPTLMTEKTMGNTAWILVFVGIAAGIVYYLSLFLSQKNISVNGMGISSFFSQAGLVGSLMVAFVFFDEAITAFQWFSIAGILLSILLLTSDSKKIKIKSPVLLVAVCLGNMAVGASNKFYAKYAIESYKTAFLTVAFLFAFLTASAKILWDLRSGRQALRSGKAELFCGITLGSANLLYSYLNLKCLESLPAAIVVPTLSAGGLIVSTLLAVLLFKEPTSKRHIFAIGLSCIFIFLLNL